MSWHQRWALVMLCGALVMDMVLGLLLAHSEAVPVWHGIYCSTGLTTTDGCDIPFTHAGSYVIATFAEVLMVPWWTGIFSFFTTALITAHTDKRHDELKNHLAGGAGDAER